MILGLDVSSVATGYSIIDSDGLLLDYGVIKPKSKNYDERLHEIYLRLRDMLDGYSGINDAYIEGVFVCRNASTTIKLSQVRGVAILACIEQGINVHNVAPMLVKKHLGNTKADKKYIIDMVNELYSLTITDDNIADAIALARYGYERKKHEI